MIILRESSYITVPWKNGGGVTREILRSPPESTAFDWRLSLATIDLPGPFSAFEGYHRTLVLVRGAGVELNFAAHGRSEAEFGGPNRLIRWRVADQLHPFGRPEHRFESHGVAAARPVGEPDGSIDGRRDHSNSGLVADPGVLPVGTDTAHQHGRRRWNR